MNLRFETAFDPQHGTPVPVAPGVLRITANNPGPYTFHGTNSYLLGDSRVAVIDPGPDDGAHFEALLSAIGGRSVSHILVTHRHRDHVGLAGRLAAATGAPIAALVPRYTAPAGETGGPEAGAGLDLAPDLPLQDEMTISGGGWTARVIHTPGHASDHASFALEGTGVLFSGDHVMGWSTTVVAPPDGNMADYMDSLDRLLARDDRLFLPGHGAPVRKPQAYMRALKTHRQLREAAVLDRLRAGDRTIPEIVAAIYRSLDPRLQGAAAMSVLAHLEHLVGRGLAQADPAPSLGAEFRAVDQPR